MVQQRVVPVLGALLAANRGRVIAAVAHNVVNCALLAHLLQVPLARYRRIIQKTAASI